MSSSTSVAVTVTSGRPADESLNDAVPATPSASWAAAMLTFWLAFQLAGVNVSEPVAVVRSASPPDCFVTATVTFDAGCAPRRTPNVLLPPSLTDSALTVVTIELLGAVTTSSGLLLAASLLLKRT